jgi:outer membrane murein-binding lipoprotein Lpp
MVFPGFVTCPNRFSERELRTMGFTDIPAPKADACVTQANNLVTQINNLDVNLAATRRNIEAANVQLSTISGRIAAIESQYPTRILPPDVYATYTSLIDQYNRLLAENNARIDAFNDSVEQRNTLARQPLRC